MNVVPLAVLEIVGDAELVMTAAVDNPDATKAAEAIDAIIGEMTSVEMHSALGSKADRHACSSCLNLFLMSLIAVQASLQL
jgi:hypothetical protein